MPGNSGGGDTTTVQEPWAGVQPHLSHLFGQGRKAFRGGPVSLPAMSPQFRQQGFMEQTGMPNMAALGQYDLPAQSIQSGLQLGFVPFTGGERSAMDMINAEAQMGRPTGIYGTAQTAGGQYLSPSTNPHLRETYQAASEPLIESYEERILPALRSQFIGAGQGAGGPQEWGVAADQATGLGRSLADLSAGIYGPAYQQERVLQEGALGRLPGMGLAAQQQGLRSADAMARTGAVERGMADQAMQGLVAQQMDPWQRLQMYSGILQPGLSFGQTSQPYFQNQMASMLGLGATGAGIGAMAGGPLGAGIGAGAGLGLGGLGMLF